MSRPSALAQARPSGADVGVAALLVVVARERRQDRLDPAAAGELEAGAQAAAERLGVGEVGILVPAQRMGHPDQQQARRLSAWSSETSRPWLELIALRWVTTVVSVSA